MGDLDAETTEWLGSLKLGDKLQYLSDFENGYYMGVVFERLNLARGRKFKNTKDMACKFQNFKNVRDLLMENFKVEFPIQNILFNTEELLKTLRDCCKRYNREKKEATLKRIQTFSESKIQPHEEKLFASRQREILSTSKMSQTGKFPRKIQQIEQKLQKYRDIKTKHELFALQDRRSELQQNRRLIEQHRLFEINKVRTNHEFTKEQQRKVFDIWMKTESIKKARIEKDNNLNRFLDEKKQKFYKSMRDEEVKSFKEGQEAFQLNCIRQGIELEHDPDKPKIKTEQNFNQQVVMQRIKDNIKIHDKERKERIKRENKKAVDAKQANIKSQAIWNQNNLVEDYAKKMVTHIGKCNQIHKEINREKAEKKIGNSKALSRTFTELPQSKIDDQARKEQYRHRNIQYLDEKVQRLERRQKKHKAIADNVLEAIIQAVIANQDHYYDKKGFTYGEWKKIQNQFLGFEKKDKRIKDHSKYVDSSYQSKAKEYVKQEGVWQADAERKQNKLELAEVLSTLIGKAYPMAEPPKKNEQLPLYMPLKLGLVGDSLSGKTTIAQKLNTKYGVILINPQAIINEAFELNKEPVAEDPKKKKQSKKPEEQNPEKIALKEWGADLMKRLNNPSNATIEHFIEAVQFKLKYCFEQKVGEQIIKQFEEAKLQETQRLGKALKQFEQIQKKGKKDSKKGGQDPQEPPTERKYFYTKGFVLDGVDLSLENVKILERKLNGFLSFEERINAKGQEIKQVISNIIPIPKAIKDNRFQNGSFDLLIELEAKGQVIQSRQTAEKAKGHHIDRSQLEKYYSAFGDQQTKRRAYCKVINDTTVEEGLVQISKHIESYLDSKYEMIQKVKSTDAIDQPTIQVSDSNSSPITLALNSITNKQGQFLIQKFTEVYHKYFTKITESFSEFDSLREDFGKIIISTQQVFISIINRPDDKAGKILNFQQNYNKLLTEKTNIVKDAEASKHLISKLDELYDSLWTSLQAKKNEAVNERQRVMNSSILNHEIQKTIEVSKKLIENELNLLVEIIFFIYNVSNALNGVKQEVPTEYLVLGIPPTSEPIASFDGQTFKSSRLEYYINQTATIIKQLSGWLKKRQKKFKIAKNQFIDRILAEFIKDRVSHILFRIGQIKQRTKQIYLEYYCFFKVLVNKMDDWIILGIKYENQFVYDIYKNVKKNIQQARKSNIKDLFVKQITEILHPISSLSPNRLPIVESTKELKLKILSFATFMQEIRCLASSSRIPFKQFTSYLEKRKKSKLLEHEFLTIQLDIMQQYLVTDDYCNYKEVALSMLLWNCKILDEDEINEYQKSLCDKTTNSQGYEFLKEDLTFNQFKIMHGIVKTSQEERILRLFIFQIFRQEFRDTISIKQLIETLKLFVQLQVYRYGDTLMMLREASHKHIEAPL